MADEKRLILELHVCLHSSKEVSMDRKYKMTTERPVYLLNENHKMVLYLCLLVMSHYFTVGL